jgi:hypothetical protein
MARTVLFWPESLYEIKKRIGTHAETQGAIQQVAHGTVEQGWDEAKVKMDSFISQNISRPEV